MIKYAYQITQIHHYWQDWWSHEKSPNCKLSGSSKMMIIC